MTWTVYESSLRRSIALSLTEPLYQVDVERRLDLLNEQLNVEVERFVVLCVERAEAEA